MKETQPEPPPISDDVTDADDAAVQITPLDHGVDVGVSSRRWPTGWHIAPRKWALILRAGLIGGVALLIVVVLASSALSPIALTRSALSRLFPAPSPTLPPIPGGNLFYLDTNVPYEHITLDGRPLRYLPRLGVDPPLALAPGHHVIAWSAYPFRTLSCTVSAPYVFGDTCDYAPYRLSIPRSNLAAQVLMLNESVATLPNNLQPSLMAAVQKAIRALHSSAPIQPGESYIFSSRSTVFATARRPLIATLRFSLGMQPTSSSPLVIDGAPCLQICFAPWRFPATSPVPMPRTPGTWLSVILVNLSWDYTTPGGRAIAYNEPVDLGPAGESAHPILARTTWTGTSWQVTPLVGRQQAPPLLIYDASDSPGLSPLPSDVILSSTAHLTVADDPACVAAQDLFQDDDNISAVRFISGPNMADGCLVAYPVLTHAPVAYYLEHFGLLLAVNKAAYDTNPAQYSLADAYEQGIARQLLTPSGQSSQFGL